MKHTQPARIISNPHIQVIAERSIIDTVKLVDFESVLPAIGHAVAVGCQTAGDRSQRCSRTPGLGETVAISPDGKWLATGCNDGALKLWHIEAQELRAEEKHEGGIRSLAFAPQGFDLVTGGANGRLWHWRFEPDAYPRKVFRDVNWYLQNRLYRFYRRKSQRRSRLYSHRAYEKLVKAGLVVL